MTKTTGEGRMPGDPSPRELLERIIRVDQAGEYGAVRIYQGQRAVLGRRASCAETLRHMEEQERQHLDCFTKLVAERRVRPTLMQPLWHVMGTAGGLVGTNDALHWKYVDFSRLPPRPVERAPTPDRSYNTEELQWCEERWKAPPDLPSTQVHFDRDLYYSLRESAPLVVTPESVRRQIEVLEKCRQLCPVT